MSKVVLACFWLCLVAWIPNSWGGALEDYVKQPDPSYSYSLKEVYPGPKDDVYVLDMISQVWHLHDVDKPLWRHRVSIIVPHHLETSVALLWIIGGENKHGAIPQPEISELRLAREIAGKINSVVVVLQNVPNQPLVFLSEGKHRYEDDIIAYSWRKYIDTGDATWPLLLPMVKSVVRGMDSAQDFLKKQHIPSLNVKGFVVTGISKRGWAAWLTGAVDPRVIGIAPMAIDVLNMSEHMLQQKECYGNYSSELQRYTDLGLTDFLTTFEAKSLREIVDPYSYRDKLVMPKLIVMGAGDPFWTLEATTLYFPGLLPEKYLLYVPNCGHRLNNHSAEIIKTFIHFFNCVAQKKPMPRFTWKIKNNGSYIIQAKKPYPVEARLWFACSDRPDFREDTIGEVWHSKILMPVTAGIYSGRLDIPKKGYIGFFIEFRYQDPSGFQYSLSTLPKVYPCLKR